MDFISKDNILDLVSDNYHSCILTSFSFDSHYFDSCVMRQFRSKGVGNILLFIDEGVFQSQLGSTINGNIRPYSINSIEAKGCFNPKINLFYGENEALLIIGSGNISSSGHGKNDEIWAAYHFDVNNQTHKPLFAEALNYIESFTRNICGCTQDKLKWIKEYSPWLKNIENTDLGKFHVLDLKNQIKFLANDDRGNIYNKLVESLSEDDISEIIVISPFYDSKGRFLEAIYNDFPKARLSVIMDDNVGVFPNEMNSDIVEDISFYSWNDCYLNGSSGRYSHLHANIFIFKTKSDITYCMFGSANASAAAMGLDAEIINSEVSLLMKSRNKDFLNDLDISINTNNSKKLSAFTNKGFANSLVSCNSLKDYRILSVDKELESYKLCVDRDIDSNIELHLFNSVGGIIINRCLTKNTGCYSTDIYNGNESVVYVCLYDVKKNRYVSNKQIVQDVLNLAKTIPDPDMKVIDVLLSGVEQGDDLLLAKLVDFISLNKLENESNNYKSVQFLNTSIYRVADCLSSIFKTVDRNIIENRFLDDEEIDKYKNKIEKEGRLCCKKYVNVYDFNSSSRKIINYFKNLDKDLDRKAELILNSILTSQKNEFSIKPVGINELSSFTIATHLAIHFTDNYFNCDDGENRYSSSILTSVGYKNMTNLSFIIERIIGKFLLTCVNKFQTYDSKYVNEKFRYLRIEAFYNCMFCIGSYNWPKSKFKNRDLLYLNCMHFLANDLDYLLDKKNFFDEMLARVKHSFGYDRRPIGEMYRELRVLKTSYDLFLRRKEERSAVIDSKDLEIGMIVFTSRSGFSSIFDLEVDNGKAKLLLSRPGFKWCEYNEDYLFYNDNWFSKNLVF